MAAILEDHGTPSGVVSTESLRVAVLLTKKKKKSIPDNLNQLDLRYSLRDWMIFFLSEVVPYFQ